MSEIKTRGDAMVAALVGIVPDCSFGLHLVDTVEGLTEQAIRVIPSGLDLLRASKCGQMSVSLSVYVYTPLMHKTDEDHFTVLEQVLPAMQGTNGKNLTSQQFMDWNGVIAGKMAISVFQISY